MAAGCSSPKPSKSSSSTTSAPERTTSTTAPTTTTTTTTDPAHPISVAIDGLPSTITRGSAPVVFRIVVSNSSDSAAFDVAPLFTLAGPPCNCVQGTLERQDPTTNIWAPAPFPQGDGYNPLERAEGGVIVPARGSVTIEMRLTVSSANPPKSATASASAVQLPEHTELAVVHVPVEIIR